MPALLASIFPHAIEVALSPLPISAVILLLLSGKPRANSLAFLFGWVVAIFANVAAFMLIVSIEPKSPDSKDTAIAIINGILGIFLLYLAYKQWNLRPKAGHKPKTPKWMNAVDQFTPIKSFIIALTLVTINAKNTVIDIATGTLIARSANTPAESFIALTIFALISSITIAIPVFAYLIFGNTLAKTLTNLKKWFIYNSSTILSILFCVLGAELLYKAFFG
jgi:hypothetical protein